MSASSAPPPIDNMLGRMARIDGVLFDIDGVLVMSWQPIHGAPGAVAELRNRGLRRAFLTNTTSQTRSEIARHLTAADVEVETDEIVTAAKLTAEYLRAHYPESGSGFSTVVISRPTSRGSNLSI